MAGRAKENLPGGRLEYQFVYWRIVYLDEYVPYIQYLRCV